MLQCLMQDGNQHRLPPTKEGPPLPTDLGGSDDRKSLIFYYLLIYRREYRCPAALSPVLSTTLTGAPLSFNCAYGGTEDTHTHPDRRRHTALEPLARARTRLPGWLLVPVRRLTPGLVQETFQVPSCSLLRVCA